MSTLENVSEAEFSQLCSLARIETGVVGKGAFCVYKKGESIGECPVADIIVEFCRRHPETLFIEVVQILVRDSDPPITVLNVVLVKKRSSWNETFASADGANTFLKGVRACAGLTELGFIIVPHMQTNS